MIWFVSDPHGGQDVEGLEKYLAQRQPGDQRLPGWRPSGQPARPLSGWAELPDP